MMVTLLLRPATICFPLIPLPPPSSAESTKMAFLINNMMTTKKGSIISASASSSSSSITAPTGNNRKLPILLFDIMDTIVRDPFYHDVPAFFRMPFKELMKCKHPTAWFEFEKGLIDEAELARKFFKDGRPFDLEGLKDCMRRGYYYVEGVEELLNDLKQNNFELHAFTNYPIWYKMIEDKLKISRYLSWTFCSCTMGKRKPDPDFYLEVPRYLQVEPESCIFIDDGTYIPQMVEKHEAAVDAGIIGLHFKNAELLRRDLSLLGIEVSTKELNDEN